jgi:hypothetical protein
MPLVRPSDTSTADRRRRLADKIEVLGFRAMAPCPQCVKARSVCVVKKGGGKCSCCVRKNVKCGGNFFDAEFDTLEAKRTILLKKKVDARARLTALA